MKHLNFKNDVYLVAELKISSLPRYCSRLPAKDVTWERVDEQVLGDEDCKKTKD